MEKREFDPDPDVADWGIGQAMRVKVVYYGFLKFLAGTDEADLELDAPEPSVLDAVASVAARLGSAWLAPGSVPRPRRWMANS